MRWPTAHVQPVEREANGGLCVGASLPRASQAPTGRASAGAQEATAAAQAYAGLLPAPDIPALARAMGFWHPEPPL
jgi:hypothetical protein